MTRPKPRPSRLAGTGAITPPPGEAQPAADTSTPATPTVSAASEAPARKAARGGSAAGKRNKIAIYMDEDDVNRARAAYAETTTPSREGPKSFSAFIVEAVLKETERLERKYNGGEQWPPVEAWQIPQGRPTGARTRKGNK
ncbi:ParB family protein [Tomitella gaofuii]|uniref:ParB family protein n=1 Tax=Tomitella gaofuii TaxID=2760083 RepID=UPI0015FB41C8|nr:hypothetical protein [Tomitella gaofuii]